MPSEFLEQIRIERDIKFALTEFNKEILPGEIFESHLVNWILRFADINQEQNEIYDYDRYNERNDKVFAQLIKNALEDNIIFYFTSLMHIGRVWKVSQLAIKDITSALKIENLSKSSSLNSSLFQNTIEYKFTNDQYNIALSYILERAERNHYENYNKAKQWWQTWEVEVGELIRIIENVNYDYQNNRSDRYGGQNENTSKYYQIISPLVSFSFKNKRLVRQFKNDGIEIQLNNNSDQIFLTLSQLISMPQEDRGRIERLLYDYLRSKEMDLELLKEHRLAPVIELAEGILLKQFEQSNPFDRYSLLNSVPDNDLRILFVKCKLPNSQIFYFAQNWLDSLENDFDYYYSELKYKEDITELDKYTYAKRADSIIKRHWVQDRRDKILNDSELIQEIFEEKWIKPIALAATYSIRKKEKSKWFFESFIILIKTTIEYLNSIGYKIQTPSSTRLKILWDKSSKDSYINDW